MAEIRISFLGGIRIEREGEEVGGEVLPRKLIALLAVLCAEGGRRTAVGQTCRLLWPGVEESRGRKSLNQLLVRARRAVPGVIERPDEQLLALGAGVASDVGDLLYGAPSVAGMAPGRAALEFLPGFSVAGCPELNDRLDAMRVQVRVRAVRLALERAAALPPEEARSWADLAYGLDRTDERAAAAHIRAVAALKGPAAAWSAFTEHRRWLADELDVRPSAALTALVAEACRQAGPLPAARRPQASPESTAAPGQESQDAAHPFASGPGSLSRRAGRLVEFAVSHPRAGVVAALSVLTVLSVLAWRQLRTPAVEAGTRTAAVVVSTPLAGTTLGDSALRLAVAHLALHGVRADPWPGPSGSGGIRVLLPGWRGAAPGELSVGAPARLSAERLAAAVVDSALDLLHRRAPVPATSSGRARTDPLLRKADSALATAKALVASGGPSAALLMLESADSLAARASRAHPGDWRPHLVRADIANQVFWYGLATGSVDPAVLHRGLALADTAVRRAGGTPARKVRAGLGFSLWVFGAPGALEAGEAAQRDYVAVVAATPGDGEAWSRLAQLYHADGRLGDAYAAALQALPTLTGPARLDAFMELFLAALDRDDNPTAGHWCSEIGFHYAESWFAATCAAMYAWADTSTPVPTAQPALLAEPSEVRPLMESRLALLLAGAQLARGQQSAAAPRIQQASSGAWQDPEVISTWAGILVEQGRPDSALAALRTYLRGAPSRRVVVGRPWLRPLYRPYETWQQFVARLTADTAALADNPPERDGTAGARHPRGGAPREVLAD